MQCLARFLMKLSNESVVVELKNSTVVQARLLRSSRSRGTLVVRSWICRHYSSVSIVSGVERWVTRRDLLRVNLPAELPSCSDGATSSPLSAWVMCGQVCVSNRAVGGVVGRSLRARNPKP